jgi:hypothetical protein
VDVPHSLLGHLSVRQVRNAACLFDLIDDPVPIADGLQGDRGSLWEPRQEGPDGAWLVIDPGPLHRLTVVIEDGEERTVLAQP